MAKVVPAHEIGLPEGAGRVRVSTSRARRGKILAVEHPVFGWIGYREWALLGYVERLVERIGPLELVAWFGLTIINVQTIKTVTDLQNWVQGFAGDVGDFFSGIGQAIFGAAIPETTAAIGAAFGGVGQGLQDFIDSVQGLFAGTVVKYFWAAFAAAMTIMALKRI